MARYLAQKQVTPLYGNRYTTAGAQTGKILQKASHAIQSNNNYLITAPIYLEAGEYTVSYYTDAAGSRPFIICEALPNGDPVPVEDGEVWYRGTPSTGTNTDTFIITRDMMVLISCRNSFTNVSVELNNEGQEAVRTEKYSVGKLGARYVNNKEVL